MLIPYGVKNQLTFSLLAATGSLEDPNVLQICGLRELGGGPDWGGKW